MRYLDSLTDFFKSPRWTMNLLFAAVCTLIPVVGPIVLHGWLVGGFWGRNDSDPATFPDFDFNRFTKYLMRGLWPFLVALVFSLVFMAVIMALAVAIMTAISVIGSESHGGGHHEFDVLAVLLFLVGFAFYLALIVFLNIALKPFLLRAELTQDFAAAFDFRFALRFLKLTWVECVVSALFIMVAGLALMAAGMLVFCIGMYFVTGPMYFMMSHLNKQIYQLYLARGGEPVAFSPALRDDPPPFPA
jgi:hypothetical protein